MTTPPAHIPLADRESADTKPTDTGSSTDIGPTDTVATDGWSLYLLLCSDGRTYAGIAKDVVARFALHRSGKGARFTRANKPVRILGVQAFLSRSEASRAEYELKQLTRQQRLAWAAQHATHLPAAAEEFC